VGNWANATYDTRSAKVLGTIVSGSKIGVAVTQSGSFGNFAVENVLRAAATLTAATATATLSFSVSGQDNWVIANWTGAVTGNVTSTIRYVSPSGLNEPPIVIPGVVTSTSDATLNAIAVKGLYAGQYVWVITTSANIDNLAAVSLEF
jgi:hypothetical protein